MVWQVKSPAEMTTCHTAVLVKVLATQFLIQFLANLHPVRAAHDNLDVSIPHILVGDPDRVQGSWLWLAHCCLSKAPGK